MIILIIWDYNTLCSHTKEALKFLAEWIKHASHGLDREQPICTMYLCTHVIIRQGAHMNAAPRSLSVQRGTMHIYKQIDRWQPTPGDSLSAHNDTNNIILLLASSWNTVVNIVALGEFIHCCYHFFRLTWSMPCSPLCVPFHIIYCHLAQFPAAGRLVDTAMCSSTRQCYTPGW